MTVSWKDGFKLFGLVIVSACAVFVCTFFLSFYLDALAVKDLVSPEATPLYEAQIMTAQLVCAISGGCLGIVSVILMIFYVKLYLDSHAKDMGVLKAMGYTGAKIACGFWVFGFGVLVGAGLGFGGGYAVAPLIYNQMGGEGLPDIPVHFHGELFVLLVILPALLFAGLAVLYARYRLNVPAVDLMREREPFSKGRRAKGKERPLLIELCFATLGRKKSLVFFVGFACFCFASMLQMATSMEKYSSVTMGAIIFAIGVVLAVTSLLLAFTSAASANAKTVALMKAYGYSLPQCSFAVFGGYRIAAAIGFALGTVYQWGLMKLMLELIFGGMEGTEGYSFSWGAFWAVLGAFVILYEAATAYFTVRAGKRAVIRDVQ